MPIDLNNPKTWCNAEIHNAPSGVDAEAYQVKINEICGLTFSGKNTVELVWMPAMENYSYYYSDWDAAGNGTKTVLRGMYKYRTFNDPQGNPIDIPPPRWALKQYQSAAQYLQTDELTRWRKTESNFVNELTETGIQSVAKQSQTQEIRPPHSKEGRYIPFISIGKHNGHCCAQAQENKDICYGAYRAPDDAYLNLLRACVKYRDEETNGQNPYEPISPQTLRQAAREAAVIEARNKEIAAQSVSSLIDESYGEMMRGLTGEKIVPTKEFSLPSNYKKRNGIIVPSNDLIH